MNLEECYFWEKIDNMQTHGRRKNFNDGFASQKIPNTVFKKPITYKKGREGLNWLDSCSYAVMSGEERHVLTYHFMIGD